MPNDAIPASVGSPEGSSYYEIVDHGCIQKIVQEYEPSMPLSTQLPNASLQLKGKKKRVPHYGAGFFIDGIWFREVYLPRVKLDERRRVLDMLRRDPELKGLLHPTTRIIYYHDHAGCAFLSLCSNLSRFDRRDWFSRRDKVLDAVCKSLQFDETETAQAKQAFAWHMIGPACYDVVPKKYIVGP